MITSTRILTTDCVDPHSNLALEDELLQALPDGQAILFLWRNKHTVVIGAGQNAWRECNTALLEAEGGTLARRSTGGGAVYHDLGNLNFSFIVPRDDYHVGRQLSVVLEAVRRLGIRAQASGRNDISADGRKFSGNAFRLLKHAALHHGTLMVNVEVSMLPRYLNVDPTKLDAKGVKSVPSRVVNLGELSPNASIDSAREAMIEAFANEYGAACVEDADGIALPGLAERVRKYQSWDWNYGASPTGAQRLYHRFPWGALELSYSIQNGRLQNVQAFTDAMDETLHIRLAQALEGAPYEKVELQRRAETIHQEDIAKFLSEAVN